MEWLVVLIVIVLALGALVAAAGIIQNRRRRGRVIGISGRKALGSGRKRRR